MYLNKKKLIIIIIIYIYIGARGAVVIALPLNYEVAGSIPTGD